MSSLEPPFAYNVLYEVDLKNCDECGEEERILEEELQECGSCSRILCRECFRSDFDTVCSECLYD